MYVFPVLRWLKVFSQTWEGDVTMVLPSSFMQLKKSVTNPTNKDLLDACKQVCCHPSLITCKGSRWPEPVQTSYTNCTWSWAVRSCRAVLMCMPQQFMPHYPLRSAGVMHQYWLAAASGSSR